MKDIFKFLFSWSDFTIVSQEADTLKMEVWLRSVGKWGWFFLGALAITLVFSITTPDWSDFLLIPIQALGLLIWTHALVVNKRIRRKWAFLKKGHVYIVKDSLTNGRIWACEGRTTTDFQMLSGKTTHFVFKEILVSEEDFKKNLKNLYDMMGIKMPEESVKFLETVPPAFIDGPKNFHEIPKWKKRPFLNHT